ncbi:phosphopyruvate hydratase [Micromonospora sp. WMMD998]|uniref:phosphopyruvate hydratase n=1 Tax=Micromonospora sp. WMMD998 TaxID=3016092 RepID=UPI00249A577E|nr:phosphopyruvate hydratase [Micromonospora sp. WMMD998]WFE38821.1 phosphopyruvate hydratase [Micromonospora sp. WMMD998]
MTPVAVERVRAREVLSSRGRPTLSVAVRLTSGTEGVTSVPSGTTDGAGACRQRRDGDERRYGGDGVLSVCRAIEEEIAPALAGRVFACLADLDDALTEIDGTPDRARYGANASLGVSQAFAVALSRHRRRPLHALLSEEAGVPPVLPRPFFNVLNGGKHAANGLRMLEFMVVPTAAPTIGEAIRCGAEVYRALNDVLQRSGTASGLGFEGGFAPEVRTPEEALDLLVEALSTAGYTPSDEVAFAIDVEADSIVDADGYDAGDGSLGTGELIERYAALCARYPLVSLEDPLASADVAGLRNLTRLLGAHVQLVGDAPLGTNAALIRQAAAASLGNAALIKPNQAGTVTAAFDAVRAARSAGWGTLISHRSSDTCDSFLADFAVGCAAGQIKAGAPAGGEHVAKYNRLLEIGESAPALPFPPLIQVLRG